MDITDRLRQANREKRVRSQVQGASGTATGRTGRTGYGTNTARQRPVDPGSIGSVGKALEPWRDPGQGLAERYYSSTDIRPAPLVSGYSGIKEVVARINEAQTEFDQIQRRTNAKGMEKACYHLYDAALKVAGREKRYSTEIELFDRQIRNVGELNQILANVTVNGKKELDSLRSRVDSVIGESENSLSQMKSMQSKLPKQMEQLERKRDKLAGMKQSDEGYFGLKREVLDLERNVDEMYGGLTLWKQVYNGSSRHQDNIIYMEKLFMTSLNTAANLAVITKQIGETLYDSRRTFAECGNLVYASAAVSGGLDVLAGYNRELNQRFIEGVRSMQRLIHERGNVNMIDGTNDSLRGLISDVKSMNLDYDTKTDRLVEIQDGRP